MTSWSLREVFWAVALLAQWQSLNPSTRRALALRQLASLTRCSIKILEGGCGDDH